MRATVSIIAAIGKNRELGKDNKLLWHISDDLKRFRRLTIGHPVIMGRTTFESIGKPLAGRMNIVVTRNPMWRAAGVKVAHTIEEAIEYAEHIGPEGSFIIGGAQIYEAAFPHTDKLYLTRIDAAAEADSFFPAYEDQFTKKVFEERHESDGLRYAWTDLER